jgi:hypothetical protein
MGSPLSPKTLRVAGQALGFTDEAGDAIRQLSKPIRAYHGSPHSFDAFDASKIGTGEGAQAYGHGLYFAGSEDTADFYRRKLAEDGDAPERWARDYWAAQAQPGSFGSPEEAYDYLLSHIRSIRNAGPGSSYSPGLKKHYAAAEKWLLSQSPYTVPDPIRQGHMYEVEIGHPEESLLDYDRPFATPGGIRGAAVLRQENPDILTEPMLRALRDGSWRFESYAGWQNAAEALARLPKTQSGAQALMEAGVPGIRYLDGGSRAAGDGTRNYVIFPGAEDKIRILRKFGLLAPMAAGAAMEEQ